MSLIKNFCRLATYHELSDDEVIEFFDIVQSVVPTKLLTGFSNDGEIVSVDVISYTDSSSKDDDGNDQKVYEIVLNENIDPDDGDTISKELADEFDFDFEFEASIEI